MTLDGKNHGGVRVSIGDTRVVEGDSGAKVLDFVVQLSRAAEETIDLTYSTEDDLAAAGSDYVGVTD
ncbi:MAG: hypothetical protein GWO24_28730, partial [Akkermansiaceae bacterium]|nr:hypothetical protein [Akkermansiaceae bacterium]